MDQMREIRTELWMLRDLVMSANEETIAVTALRMGEVELRDRATGELRKTLRFPSHVPTMIMSPGDHLILGCVDGTVLIHDVAEGTELALPRMDFEIRSMATSSEGDFLALSGMRKPTYVLGDGAGGDRGHQLVIICLKTHRIVKRLTRPSEGQTLTWSSDGKLLALGGSGGISVLSTKSWEELYRRKDERLSVLNVQFSPDGKILASCGHDGVVRLSDAKTGEPLGDPMTGHAGFIWRLAFSPDGKTLFTTCGDETLGVWDVASRELRARIPDHIGGSYGLCVSRSGEWLLTGGIWDNKIHVRRLKLRPPASKARE